MDPSTADTSRLAELWQLTAFPDLTIQMVVMWVVIAVLFYLAVWKQYEPLLLIPIAFGALLANLPTEGLINLPHGDHPGGLYYYISLGVQYEIFPPLIFLGVGALTDFGPLIANPRTLLLGAAAQFGVFATFLGRHGNRVHAAWKPVPSASSAAPTVRPRSSWPTSSRRICSRRSRWPPTATWPWCRCCSPRSCGR